MPSESPLFRKLIQSGLVTDEDHDALATLTADPKPVHADAVLIEQGARLEAVPLIASGYACRYRLLKDGRRQILGILLPGDICDVQGTILGRSDHFTVAVTACQVTWLTKRVLDDLTLADTRIARAFWWSTLVDECILRTWLTNMGQQDSDKRLGHFFCELLLRLQLVNCADGDSCDMPFGQEMLADTLGITAVHVSRTLKELRERKLIHLKSKRLTILNVNALWAFSEFDPSYMHLARRIEAADDRDIARSSVAARALV